MTARLNWKTIKHGSKSDPGHIFKDEDFGRPVLFAPRKSRENCAISAEISEMTAPAPTEQVDLSQADIDGWKTFLDNEFPLGEEELDSPEPTHLLSPEDLGIPSITAMRRRQEFLDIDDDEHTLEGLPRGFHVTHRP